MDSLIAQVSVAVIPQPMPVVVESTPGGTGSPGARPMVSPELCILTLPGVDALVRPWAGRPGGQPRARAPAPRRLPACGHLSEVDTQIAPFEAQPARIFWTA